MMSLFINSTDLRNLRSDTSKSSPRCRELIEDLNVIDHRHAFRLLDVHIHKTNMMTCSTRRMTVVGFSLLVDTSKTLVFDYTCDEQSKVRK